MPGNSSSPLANAARKLSLSSCLTDFEVQPLLVRSWSVVGLAVMRSTRIAGAVQKDVEGVGDGGGPVYDGLL